MGIKASEVTCTLLDEEQVKFKTKVSHGSEVPKACTTAPFRCLWVDAREVKQSGRPTDNH
jgi:hypothetical protein